jgi:hypothetical protein
LKPEYLSISGIGKRKMIITKQVRAFLKALDISFCLLKNILRPYTYFLALNTCQWYPFEEENVISRTILGWVFFNRALGILGA